MADSGAEPTRKFETPWTIRQTESHLVFGPLSRHFPFAYIAVVIVAVGMFAAIRSGGREALRGVWVGFAVAFLFKLTVRQQAIVGWLITKIMFSTLAVMAVIIIFPMTLTQHQPEAWSILALGLIWFPILGALPSLTLHQKYFTLARALLSVPALIWFSRTATFT